MNMKILITGGSSMIGMAVITSLKETLPRAQILFPTHSELDLLRSEDIEGFANKYGPIDSVIHLAGYNGNISFNKKYPADIFYQTTLMGINILHWAAKHDVKKILSVLPSCSYPNADVLKEEDFWAGLPNETVECHGLAKRNLLAYSRQIWKQYRVQAISVILNNCYGPYDSFSVEKTKVVGGLISKFVDAKRFYHPKVVCWGTGKPKRELLYSADAGEAIVNAISSYDDVFIPLNISTGEEVSIKELAEMIKEIVGYEGEIVWDETKPDGQMRKLLDSTRVRELGFIKHPTPLREGLERTIDWYEKSLNHGI